MSASGATEWMSAEHSMGVRFACPAPRVSAPPLCPVWMRGLATAVVDALFLCKLLPPADNQALSLLSDPCLTACLLSLLLVLSVLTAHTCLRCLLPPVPPGIGFVLCVSGVVVLSCTVFGTRCGCAAADVHHGRGL